MAATKPEREYRRQILAQLGGDYLLDYALCPRPRLIRPLREIRRSWARLIRRVDEVDPVLGPRCNGMMRVIAVIERPAIIRQILDHLGLPMGAPSLRAPPAPSERGNGVATGQLREWSAEPFFDDLHVVDVGDPAMA